MKANELRKKLKICITGVALAAMVTSMAACSAASTGSTGGSGQAAAQTSAEAESVAEETAAESGSAESERSETTEAAENAAGARSGFFHQCQFQDCHQGHAEQSRPYPAAGCQGEFPRHHPALRRQHRVHQRAEVPRRRHRGADIPLLHKA